VRDNAQASFEIAHFLGSRFVVCPWLDPSVRQTADDWKRICDDLNKIGELASRSVLTLAYHNHDFEFAQLPGGIQPYDVLLSRTDNRFVKFELDVYWATKGKLDSTRVEVTSIAISKDIGRRWFDDRTRSRHDRLRPHTRSCLGERRGTCFCRTECFNRSAAEHRDEHRISSEPATFARLHSATHALMFVISHT
jgi:sugar phosphate isomerase/epimerase